MKSVVVAARTPVEFDVPDVRLIFVREADVRDEVVRDEADRVEVEFRTLLVRVELLVSKGRSRPTKGALSLMPMKSFAATPWNRSTSDAAVSPSDSPIVLPELFELLLDEELPDEELLEFEEVPVFP